MLFLTTSGPFGITPSSDQLIIINLAAILVGVTYNSPKKVIKWGGLIIAAITTTCGLWCGH